MKPMFLGLLFLCAVLASSNTAAQQPLPGQDAVMLRLEIAACERLVPDLYAEDLMTGSITVDGEEQSVAWPVAPIALSRSMAEATGLIDPADSDANDVSIIEIHRLEEDVGLNQEPLTGKGREFVTSLCSQLADVIR